MRSMIFAVLLGLLMNLFLIEPTIASMTGMREPLFGNTDKAREKADELDSQRLAPASYAEGVDYYQRADDTFKRAGSIDTIRRYLNKAQSQFIRSADAAGIAATALDSVIRARSDALASEAPSYAAQQWADGERYFREATRKLERSSMKQAGRYADKAEAAYRDSELTAIKANYLNETREYLVMAEKLRAPRYAPTSFKNAKRLLSAAEKELNSNRYDTDKPRSLAADAKHNALHAVYVAKLENRIRNRDTNLETVLLGWESAIGRLGDELDTPVYFDHGEAQAIETLLEALSRIMMQKTAMVQQIEDSNLELAGLNEQVAKMQELLGGGNQTIEEMEVLLAQQKKRLAQQSRHRARFATVEGLFDTRQATVLRQGDTVIIRMIGLNFDSGASSLNGEHLQILALLEDAIAEFPESRVVVEGHTDAFGSDADNLGLSQARADAVVNHLLGTLPISPANLNAMGYGESRPVANNETPEGRKRNRRIDVLIKPQWIHAQTIAGVNIPTRVQQPDLMLAPGQ